MIMGAGESLDKSLGPIPDVLPTDQLKLMGELIRDSSKALRAGSAAVGEAVSLTGQKLQEMIYRCGALDKQNEYLKEQVEQAKEHYNAQSKEEECWIAKNREALDKYRLHLAQGGQHDQRLDVQLEQLKTATAYAKRNFEDCEDRYFDCQRLTKIKGEDSEEVDVVRETMLVLQKYQQLEKAREEWRKAEDNKCEKLMKETPPPYSLRKNPPSMWQLYTHEMACFAVMGRAGTGKTTLVNQLMEEDSFKNRNQSKLKQSALAEMAMGNPPPVFLKNSDGMDFALFDRPGIGLKALSQAAGGADNTTNFIANLGLKWWTAVILVIDRDCTQEDAMIYKICKEIGTPIIVTRNKVSEDLEKEKQDCKTRGEGGVYREYAARRTIEDYITKVLGVEQGGWLLIDTYHPLRFQWDDLVAFIELNCRK